MNTELHMVGKIADSANYTHLNPFFEKAFAFLKRPDLATLPPGRYDIEPGRCWANVQEADLKPLSERKLEAHRKFIDIQAPITGSETIGLAELNATAKALPFNDDTDCVLYTGEAEPVTLNPGDFAIFFPPLGAHAPCCIAKNGPTRIKKVVVKVAVG